jgi:hypothetical protein
MPVWSTRFLALALVLLSGLVVAQQDPVIQPGDRSPSRSTASPIEHRGARAGQRHHRLSAPRSVQVANHTRFAPWSHITLLMDGFLTRPQVTVSIAEYRPIFVNGAGKLPGAHKFAEGLTVEKAIALAGALKGCRSGGIALIRENTAGGNPVSGDERLVLPGDVINIPSSAVIAAEKAKAYIYLHGEVRTRAATSSGEV